VLVVIIGVVAAFALSRHQAPGHAAAGTPASPRTSPTALPSPASSPPPASRQAAALDTLLISSSTARTALHRAVKQVAGCVNLAGAIGDLQGVVNQRSTEYSRAMTLMVSALPDGAKVKSKLTTALSLSLKADQDSNTDAYGTAVPADVLNSGAPKLAAATAFVNTLGRSARATSGAETPSTTDAK
jgi:hypothetical protein